MLGSSLAYCPGCFLPLVLGTVEPDGPLGGSGSAISSRSAWNLAGLADWLIHNLSGTAQDVAYAYARNQAQEIVTQTWSNDFMSTP